MKHVIHISTINDILEAAERGVVAGTIEGEIVLEEISELKQALIEFVAANPCGPFNLAITNLF